MVVVNAPVVDARRWGAPSKQEFETDVYTADFKGAVAHGHKTTEAVYRTGHLRQSMERLP